MTQIAAPGWYPHPSMTATRCYWDGERWTNQVAPDSPTPVRPEQPEPPGTWVFTGVLGTGFSVGAALLAVRTEAWPLYLIAVVLGVLGWVAMMAGTIAIGVRLGARWAEYERTSDR